jgi:hypothetical protein
MIWLPPSILIRLVGASGVVSIMTEREHIRPVIRVERPCSPCIYAVAEGTRRSNQTVELAVPIGRFLTILDRPVNVKRRGVAA